MGLTCLHVFGYDDPHAPDLAEKLGIAFQLTNILRDVPKDFEIGRVYLPLEDLAQFGVRTEQLAGAVLLTPEMRGLLELEAARSWAFLPRGRGTDPAGSCGRARRAVGACTDLQRAVAAHRSPRL